MTNFPSAASHDANRRRASRQRVLLTGKIVAPGPVTFDCSIRDHGAEGARLKLAADYLVGNEFHLIEVRAGVARRCEVTWRRLPQIGVRFHESWDLRGPCPKEIEHVKRLWLESEGRDSPGISPLNVSTHKPVG